MFVSTMHRVFGQHTFVAETPPAGAAPQPGVPGAGRDRTAAGVQLGHHQTWRPVKGTYFDAYVMIDIYSRYLVGVHVHAHESGVLAKELMEQTQRARRTAGRARRSGNLDDQQDRRHAAR